MADEPARPYAIVTGASAGIGEAFAKHLARKRYNLLLVARRRERLDGLAGKLTEEHGVAAEALAADLGDAAGVALVEERLAKGDTDLLVNNAGFGTVGEFSRLPIDREMAQLDLNVRALMRLSHAALAPMVERKSGAIINVASMAGFQPIPFNATYAASKAFVLHFSEALHEEAKEYGVTVTCLCPGPVKTEFQDVAGLDEVPVPAFAWESVDSVVESALSAVRARRAIAIPGVFNAMSAAGIRLAPRFVTRRVAGAIFRDQGRNANS